MKLKKVNAGVFIDKDEKQKYYGYLMTEKQAEALSEMLTENILERYNNPEYIDLDIVETFAQDNKLEK